MHRFLACFKPRITERVARRNRRGCGGFARLRAYSLK